MFGMYNTRKIANVENISFIHTDDVENGTFVLKGDVHTGETQIYDAVIPTTATLKEEAYFVATPAASDDTSRSVNQNRQNFINKKGVSFRTYKLEKDDKVDVTVYTIDGTVAEGSYVTLQNGKGNLIATSSAPDHDVYGFIGKVERIYEKGNFYPVAVGDDTDVTLGFGIDGRINYAVIEVVQNG